MKGEAAILQYRVQSVAVEWRRDEAQERVRGEQDKQQETDADHRLHGQHAGAQSGRQIAAEHRHRCPEQAEHEDPEDH